MRNTELLLLRVLVGVGGATFFALGGRFLLLGRPIADTKLAITAATDSHIRYFGVIGIGYAALMWQKTATIAEPSTSFSIVIAVIFAGGLVRLITLVQDRLFDWGVLFAAIPELVLPRWSIGCRRTSLRSKCSLNP